MNDLHTGGHPYMLRGLPEFAQLTPTLHRLQQTGSRGHRTCLTASSSRFESSIHLHELAKYDKKRDQATCSLLSRYERNASLTTESRLTPCRFANVAARW